jgi:hypothetical protein
MKRLAGVALAGGLTVFAVAGCRSGLSASSTCKDFSRPSKNSTK